MCCGFGWDVVFLCVVVWFVVVAAVCYSCVYLRYIWFVCELLCGLVRFVYVVSLGVRVLVCFCLC